MSEYDESEWEENKSDSDIEETDSIIADDELNDIDKNVKRYELLYEKLKLILRYNAEMLDLDEFNRLLKKINQDLEDNEFDNEFVNSDLLNKEYSFIELLEIYISRIKKKEAPGFISAYQINSINNLYSEIKELLIQTYGEEINDDSPLDSESLDVVFDNLIKKEMEYLKKIVININKTIKDKIIIPIQSNFNNETDFNKAYTIFYKKLSKYIQGVNITQHMNVTSLGSSYDSYKKTINDKIAESTKFHTQLPIKVSQKDITFSNNRNLLRSIMLKMEITKLINCSVEAEVYYTFEPTNITQKFTFSPIVLEKIKKYYDKLNKGVSTLLITKPLRDISIKKLLYEFNNLKLMKFLETEIYILSDNDFIEYTSKINDILFILRNYPNFKKFILDGKINIHQLALFEKEIAFETLINVTSIKNRRSTIKHIKSQLLINTIYKNKLMNNYKCNIIAKRLELLVYDISLNNKIYDLYTSKLIDYIKQNNIFNLKNEEILLILKPEKIKNVKENYSKLNIKDINALISQEKTIINSLKLKINTIQTNILSLMPSPSLKINNKPLQKKKGINMMIFNKKRILTKYSLSSDIRLSGLKQKLLNSNKKYNILKKQLIKLQEKESESINLGLHYIPETVIGSPIRFTRNKKLVIELIQAYKRKLMLDSLNLTQEIKSNINILLELLDINDFLNKNYILQKKLFVDITNLLPKGYILEDFNKYYYNRSIETIANYLKVPPNLLGKISLKLIYTPGENKLIKDYYGGDLIKTLYYSKTPEDFYKYNKKTIENYYQLNEKSIVKPVPEYRRLKILYNPFTGKFGNEANDGFLFDVEKLAMGSNGQPLEDFTHYETIDPRTNEMKYTYVKVPVPGKSPFIKVPILTNKKGDQKYIWVAVNSAQTKMYVSNHDTCSRFNNKDDCNKGKGLGNSDCLYKNGVCKVKKQSITLFGKINKF